MPNDTTPIESKKDQRDRPAKHSRLSLNSKTVDFPLKATNIGLSEFQEIDIARREIGRPIFNQITVQIKPKRLRELVTDSKAHQELKDHIRAAIAKTSGHEINVVFPMLLNERSPYEAETDFRDFPPPNVKMVEKIFDLCDVQGVDILVTPVAKDDGHEVKWAKLASEVYSKQKPFFLNEYKLSGLVPNWVSEGTAIGMAQTYFENEFDSLTFDFAAQKVHEAKMGAIVKSIPFWDEVFVCGVNVPHHDWHNTYRRPVMPTYDLLVSVYGFDSFSGVSRGFKDEPESPEKIPGKIRRKRYYVADTYGTYSKEGLTSLLDKHGHKCRCPICNRLSTPLDLYSCPSTQAGLDVLAANLKIHRLHTTHKEMKGASDLIDHGKYYDHLSQKQAAANELRSMISALE